MHEYRASAINDSTMNAVAKFRAEQEIKIHRSEAEAKQTLMRIIIIALFVGFVLASLMVFYIIKDKPRDIVSGDFFYVASCGKYNVLITADCTGHGIPGVFLSMLGISALKEFSVTEWRNGCPQVDDMTLIGVRV